MAKASLILRAWLHFSNSVNRRRLKAKNFTILAPTCIAGVIYHKLGLKFLTPTINLWLTEDDFFKFVSNLEYYVKKDVEFEKMHEELNYPIGVIRGERVEDDIRINFNHDKDFEKARKKWNIRKKRIVRDNIYIIASTRSGEDMEKITRYEKLRDRYKVVVFTAGNYKDIPYALRLRRYKKMDKVGSYMVDCPSRFLKRAPWEIGFDYVRWLNTGKVK